MRRKQSRLIYGYIDPRDGTLRYVGKSSNGLYRARHFAGHDGHCYNWAQKLINAGTPPEVFVLEDLGPDADLDDLAEAEIFHIAYWRSLGCRLTNLTSGGDAGKHSEETKAKIGAKSKAFWQTHKKPPMSEAHKEKLRQIHRGQKYNLGRRASDETRRKQSEAHKGKPKSPEWRAKIAAAHMGYKHTPEAKAKMSASRKGKQLGNKHGLGKNLGNKWNVGRHPSAETRAKMSLARRARPPFSDESRRKISEAKRRHWADPETRERILDGLRRRQGLPLPRASLRINLLYPSAHRSVQIYREKIAEH